MFVFLRIIRPGSLGSYMMIMQQPHYLSIPLNSLLWASLRPVLWLPGVRSCIENVSRCPIHGYNAVGVTIPLSHCIVYRAPGGFTQTSFPLRMKLCVSSCCLIGTTLRCLHKYLYTNFCGTVSSNPVLGVILYLKSISSGEAPPLSTSALMFPWFLSTIPLPLGL